METTAIVFFVITILFLLYMSWIFNVRTFAYFILYKAVPFILSLFIAYYLLIENGIISVTIIN